MQIISNLGQRLAMPAPGKDTLDNERGRYQLTSSRLLASGQGNRYDHNYVLCGPGACLIILATAS